MSDRPCRHRYASLAILMMLVLAVPKPSRAESFSNPVMPPEFGADPAVLHHEGVFYAYTTNNQGRVLTSPDLVNWTLGPQVLPDRLKKVWAPEGYHCREDGQFYLYYTDRYKIGVAVSTAPDRPFKDLGYLAIPGIDAHPFRDDDGSLYLYFTNTPEFAVYCLPMRSPTEPTGKAVRCFGLSADWEKRGHGVNEGVWMHKMDGRYYLFYAGGDGQTVHYAVGYAEAASPLGPFTKFSANPIVAASDEVFGPGHGTIVSDKAGTLWHLYNQKVGQERGWKRFVCLDPLEFDGDTGHFSGAASKGEKQARPALDATHLWMPEISPRGARFAGTVEVSLSARDPGAVCRYTTDGTTPTADSPEYTSPFSVAESMVIKARTFKAGFPPSAVLVSRFVKQVSNGAPPTLVDYTRTDEPFRIFLTPSPKPAAK